MPFILFFEDVKIYCNVYRKLKEMVALEPKKWTKVAKHFEGRTPKQCRERWHNHARPNVKVFFSFICLYSYFHNL